MRRKLDEAKKYFKDSVRYKDIVKQAETLYGAGCISACEEQVDRLPNERTLFSELYAKLKGKSVSRTLERIGQSDVTKLEELKGYSSLLTHAVIECEAGNMEYKMLIHRLYEKLGALIHA